MSKEIALIDYGSRDVLETIKQTVAKDASDSELKLFIETCKGSGLNPFRKEVWFIKAGGRVQIMTSIQGYHKIANSHPQYDGLESGLIGKTGEYLPQTYPGNDFIGAWCKVYRKDRKMPFEGIAFLAEYDKKQSNWTTMKRVMINKCAESVALRKAFSQEMNGLYTVEEMPAEYDHQPTVSAVPVQLQGLVKPVSELPQKEEDDIPAEFMPMTTAKKNEGEPAQEFFYDLTFFEFGSQEDELNRIANLRKAGCQVYEQDTIVLIRAPKQISALKDYQITVQDFLKSQAEMAAQEEAA